MRYLFRVLTLVLLIVSLVIPAALAQSAPLAAPSMAPGDSVFGINSHAASRHERLDTLSKPVDAVAESGAGWVREDFQFSRLEEESDQDRKWQFHDAAVNMLRERGVNIIGLLNGPTASPGRFTPPDPQVFAEFAGEVVSRYKDRIQHWEVWNEPENQLYWETGPDPAAYAELLRETYLAIKQADPNARVLMGGIVPTHKDFLRGVYDNGAWNSFDIVSLHPYVDPSAPEEGQIGTGDVSAIKTMVQEFGNKPIWATEFGWSTGPGGRDGSSFSEEEQANYLVRGSVLLRAVGVERVLWYKLKDNPGEHYGLVGNGSGNDDYSQLKPAYFAFRTLNQQLAGTTGAERLNLSQQQVVFDFEGGGGWSRGDQPNGTFSISGAQAHSGGSSGQITYNFPNAGGNDFVVFLPPAPISIPGNPGQLGIWVYGDGSSHELKVWIRDSESEMLQFRIGFISSSVVGWQYLAAPINGTVEEYNVISGGRNRQINFPAQITALVVDDNPDSFSGQGTFYVDDITAMSGPEAYGVRFPRGDGTVVDVLWAPEGGAVPLGTQSAQATVVDRGGGESSATASGGQFNFNLGPSPIFVTHVPGTQRTLPQPSQPAPQPLPVSEGERCFETTGYCMSGRIRQFWEQNGGLQVFGYPITPQRVETIQGQQLEVQWFERNRLELHPENAPPYDVLLGLLGLDALEQDGRNWQDFPKGTDTGNCLFFEQTGQYACGEFLAAWRANGLDLDLDGVSGEDDNESLALFGMPVSPPQTETLEGQQFTVQWFQRARFELHPENEPAFRVLFGLLGRAVLENTEQ